VWGVDLEKKWKGRNDERDEMWNGVQTYTNKLRNTFIY
jgi:hypothetical protein